MNAGPLLIRADASVPTGTGHVMRCLALAQGWQDAGGEAVFAMSETTEATREKLRAESCEIVSLAGAPGTLDDSEETIECARRCRSKWIVVDGYKFGAEYQKLLKSAGFRILFLDDYGHATHYAADFVLNQNVSASNALYSNREPSTRLLLGPTYALLRREFRSWRNWRRVVSLDCSRLLVMMGGSDPENLTARVIEAVALLRIKNLEVTAVVGGSSPHLESLHKAAARLESKISLQINPSNIAVLMAAADIAVSAAGSTCVELCVMGLPALLVDAADNQTPVAKELQRRGCAIHVGDCSVTPEHLAESLRSLIRSEDLRRTLAHNSRELGDGKGVERIVSVLRAEERLRLRNARTEDCQMLWEWANDADVRAASFSTAAIPWAAHVSWFSDKIGSKGSRIFIAEDDLGSPVGQIRFDIDGREAEVNISLAKEKRGRGFAVPAIEAAVHELFAEVDCDLVHAFVKPENIASMRAFQRAGFVQTGRKRVRGSLALHFVCRRN